MSQVPEVRRLEGCCSGIQPFWCKHLEFWDGDEPGDYNEMSVIVDYVIERYSEGNTQDFEGIFFACEDMLNKEDEYSNELVVLGFIETLLLASSHKPFGTEVFEYWMGPKTSENYNKLRECFEALPSNIWATYSPWKKMCLTLKKKISFRLW